jgi:hypothetical protein
MRAVTAWGEELARSGVTADLYMVGGPSAPISSRHLLVPPSGPLRDMVPGSPREPGTISRRVGAVIKGGTSRCNPRGPRRP